jgi:hypothetical protein
LDTGAVERHKEYYDNLRQYLRAYSELMLENLVNPELPVACPSTKGAPESDLTNLLVGLMQVRVSK